MKTIISVLLYLVLTFPGISQSAGISKILQNELRYWIPIGVKEETLKSTLTQGNKTYDISNEIMNLKSCKSTFLHVDKTISVILKETDSQVQAVMYLCSEGFCTGIVYLDTFENLPKWQEILKSTEEVGDNHFLLGKMYHFMIRLSPKDGMINIQIE